MTIGPELLNLMTNGTLGGRKPTAQKEPPHLDRRHVANKPTGVGRGERPMDSPSSARDSDAACASDTMFAGWPKKVLQVELTGPIVRSDGHAAMPTASS